MNYPRPETQNGIGSFPPLRARFAPALNRSIPGGFLFCPDPPVWSLGIGDRAIAVVRGLMTGQGAGIAAAVVRDGSSIVFTHHVGVKVHQAFAGNARGNRPHAMRGMTNRTGESILRNVVAMLQETGVRHHIAQTVTLGAHAVRPVQTEVGTG